MYRRQVKDGWGECHSIMNPQTRQNSFGMWNAGDVSARSWTAGRRQGERLPKRAMPVKQARPRKPQFDSVYRDFERMKQLGLVIYPEDPQNPVNPAFKKFGAFEPGEKDEFVSSVIASVWRGFGVAYPPTAHVPCWQREAGNLMNELKSYAHGTDTNAAGGNTSRLVSRELQTVVEPDQTSVERLVGEMKLSPYPDGNPRPPPPEEEDGACASGDDSDDQSPQDVTESGRLKPIGSEWLTFKKRMIKLLNFEYPEYLHRMFLITTAVKERSRQREAQLLVDLSTAHACHGGPGASQAARVAILERPPTRACTIERRLHETRLANALQNAQSQTVEPTTAAPPLTPPPVVGPSIEMQPGTAQPIGAEAGPRLDEDLQENAANPQAKENAANPQAK